jgi:hypothetical protein
MNEKLEEQQPQPETQPTEPRPDLLAKAIEKTEQENILVTDHGLDFGTFKGLWQLATLIFRSKVAPKELDSIEAICVVIAKGRTIGLDPFQSVESIAVINNKPLLFGATPLAVCRTSILWDETGFDEWFEQSGQRIKGNPVTYADDTAAVSQVKRIDSPDPKQCRFSVADAKRAGLWGKTNRDGSAAPWTAYPQRLLQARARGFNLWDNFGEALKGLAIRELNEDHHPPDIAELRRIPSAPERPQPAQERKGLPIRTAHTEAKSAIEKARAPAESAMPVDTSILNITDADLPDNLQPSAANQETPRVDKILKNGDGSLMQEPHKPKDLSQLKAEIWELLKSTGDDEFHMNQNLKEVSRYDGKWLELKNLKDNKDLLWLVHTLGALKKKLGKS